MSTPLIDAGLDFHFMRAFSAAAQSAAGSENLLARSIFSFSSIYASNPNHPADFLQSRDHRI
jgi:hypothetical protein